MTARIAQLAADRPELAPTLSKMTTYFYVFILCAEKDEKGRVVRPPAEEGEDEGKGGRLRRLCLLWGVPDYKVEATVRRLSGGKG